MDSLEGRLEKTKKYLDEHMVSLSKKGKMRYINTIQEYINQYKKLVRERRRKIQRYWK